MGDWRDFSRRILDLLSILNDVLDLRFEFTWIVIIGLFGSVILHELGHLLVPMRYNISIDSIALWMLGESHICLCLPIGAQSFSL